MISLPARYSKVIGVLHGGGMSDTLHCFDDNLQRDVVVKSLKTGIVPNKLLDELAALSNIRSRYVVQILDIIRDPSGNVVGFVEEFLPGEPLAPCSPGHSKDDALRAVYPVAAGIAEVHAHGRVHRDVKPDNMRFDANGQLKLFDFGLAKLQGAPGTKSFFYTPGFTAPEAFQVSTGGLHTFSSAVDVFAFACVGIWLLNGSVIPPALHAVPPALPVAGFSFLSVSPLLPSGIAALLEACLNSDPVSRPAMEEVRTALADELLRDKHRLLLTQGIQKFVLDQANRQITLSWQTTSTITIIYDGLSFNVTATAGTVMINNSPAMIGQHLSGSHVIVLGDGEPRHRKSVTADVSHPEVNL